MGTRLFSVAGMAICFVALLALTAIVMEPVANLWIGFLGLVGFRGGTWAVHCAQQPRDDQCGAGQSFWRGGGILNLTRILGTVAGVASASAMLSWRLQVAHGSSERRLAVFSPHHFIEAVGAGLIMLAVFAAITGALSLIRSPRPDAIA